MKLVVRFVGTSVRIVKKLLPRDAVRQIKELFPGDPGVFYDNAFMSEILGEGYDWSVPSVMGEDLRGVWLTLGMRVLVVQDRRRLAELVVERGSVDPVRRSVCGLPLRLERREAQENIDRYIPVGAGGTLLVLRREEEGVVDYEWSGVEEPFVPDRALVLLHTFEHIFDEPDMAVISYMLYAGHKPSSVCFSVGRPVCCDPTEIYYE